MPLIGPPPSGTAPAAHYSSVLAGLTGWTVTTTANQGLQMTFGGAAQQLFATSGGVVTYVPAGQPLPTAAPEAAPGAGAVVLETWPPDALALTKILPPNVAPPARVLYLNVEDSIFQAAMTPLVQALSQPELDFVWNPAHVNPAPNRAAGEAFFIAELMQGRAGLFVTGGQALGLPAHATPADVMTPSQLEVRFLDSARQPLSPMLHLRSMPSWDGPRWTGHPLVEAASSVPLTLNAHVKFEVYNVGSSAFEPLSQNVDVDLMDYDPIFGDDVLATAKTDANGVAHFAGVPDVEGSDIYFLAKPGPNKTVAGHVLPAQWSTKGWLGADGVTKGYYDNFIGNQLGESATPLVFRIGIDFHGRLRYEDKLPASKKVQNAIEGIPFGIFADGAPEAILRTNNLGEVHGVTFDIPAEKTVRWGIEFEVEDSAINLPVAKAEPPRIRVFAPHDFDSASDSAYNKVYADNGLTSLGTVATPDDFTFKDLEHDVALYLLKTLRELQVFMHTITGGAWTGISGLEYDFHAIAGIPYSWPVGEVNMSPQKPWWLPVPFYWDRETIIHETAHQVMWKEASYTTWSIGLSALQIHEGLYLTHGTNLLTNPEHALIEGWAEYVEAVFVRTFPFPLSTIDDGSTAGTTLDSSPNLGESVEAAFANALWEITRDLVIPPLPLPAVGPLVPEAWDGDVKATAPWIVDTGVRQRWRTMILEPLQAMSAPPKTTTHFVDEMRTRNPADWHRLRKRLQDYNLAIETPTVTSVTPNTGPQGGGTAITIAGDDFVEGCDVEIGGIAATAVVVVSSTSITAVTPVGGMGAFDVEVITRPALPTLSRTGLLAGGFTYV
jgi:hypothetical protein